MFNKLPYDAEKDFTLISNLYLLVEALFVSSSLNVGTAAEFKAYAQAHPAALNYGTLGPGSNPEMFLKWLNSPSVALSVSRHSCATPVSTSFRERTILLCLKV